MSVSIKDGAFVVTKGGRKKFDTRDKLMHPIGSISGSFVIPEYAHPDGTNAYFTTSFPLGAVPPLTQEVVGAMKFDGSGTLASGLSPAKWVTFMGGSLLYLIDGHGSTSSSPDPNGTINQMCWFDLRITNGQLYLDRRIACNRNSQGVYLIRVLEVEYKFSCVVWY